MKKILFIATGGTIASKKTENGLTPQITPEELLSYIPEVEGLCEITAVNPFNLDSSNVVPENWSTLVKVAKEHYEDYDGFVIAHGTDTMAYTAAAFLYDSEFGKADRHHRSTAADQFGYHGCKDKPVRQLLLRL